MSETTSIFSRIPGDWIDFDFSEPRRLPPDVLINDEGKPDASVKPVGERYATSGFQQQIIKEIVRFYSGTAKILRLNTDERRPGITTAILEAAGQLFKQPDNTKLSILLVFPSNRAADVGRYLFDRMFPSHPWSIDICPVNYVKGMQLSRFYHDLIIADDAMFLGEEEVDQLSKKTRIVVLRPNPHFEIAWAEGLPFRIDEVNFCDHLLGNSIEEVD